MGSSYTDNNKFEKIGTGEQAGTWGTTTNLNFDMIDRKKILPVLNHPFPRMSMHAEPTF